MSKYILDRIESDVAILEGENGELFNISVSLLPDEINEGDVVVSDNGEYKVLSEETNERKEKIKNLRISLREE
ncbi:MAG: DUF3006 domain-containing protein [Ruminococcus sp.]|nr:DUF3006 domain-containing protein [Ruminococcus sp.]